MRRAALLLPTALSSNPPQLGLAFDPLPLLIQPLPGAFEPQSILIAGFLSGLQSNRYVVQMSTLASNGDGRARTSPVNGARSTGPKTPGGCSLKHYRKPNMAGWWSSRRNLKSNKSARCRPARQSRSVGALPYALDQSNAPKSAPK
jgi:hypothetical protein